LTLAEERKDYPERVAAFLTKHGWRRLPWGSVVVGGGLTVTKSRHEVQARQEIGEVAITLLGALGVTAEMLDKLADLPHDTPAELLVCTMQDMRAVAAMINSAEPEVTHAPDCVTTANPSACDCSLSRGTDGP
jgi:hypothetical protein